MNLTVSSIGRYGNYNTQYNQRHSTFGNKIPSFGSAKNKEKKEQQIRNIVNNAAIDILSLAVIGGGIYTFQLDQQQEQQKKMLNEISAKLNYPNIYEVDTVIGKKGGPLDIVICNKTNGKKYTYDLVNSRQYIEYSDGESGIMHDYTDGKNYIKYKGEYIPADGIKVKDLKSM